MNGSEAGDIRIFVAIASYMDPLLTSTVRDAVQRAAKPEHLRFGVMEQATRSSREALARHAANLAYLHADPIDSLGPGWARSRAMTLHQGEPFICQIDAHMRFAPCWDERLIGALKRAAQHAGHRRIMLSNMPPPFGLDAYGRLLAPPPPRETMAIRLDLTEIDVLHGLLPASTTAPTGQVEDVCGLIPCSSFIFGSAEMAIALPPDPDLYFNGDDLALAIRAYTHGWEVWHLADVPLLHRYRTGRPGECFNHWDPPLDARRRLPALDLDARARRRLIALIQGHAPDPYGLGWARSIEDFWRESGLSLVP